MTATITVDQSVEVGPGTAEWSGTFHPEASAPETVTFRFSTPAGGPGDPSVRPFLLAFLPVAMLTAEDIVLDDPIDQVTLANLAEWQAAMAAWHPGVLHRVDIHARGGSAAFRPRPGSGAITSFSGGVDSCYTAARHSSPHRTVPVSAGLMIHGLDIALDQPATFERAFARSERILHGLGLDAYWLRTDVRSLERRWPVDWETASHGIWLAASLACLEGAFDGSVIPSTYTYDQLRLPWASNPITDPMLGSDDRPVVHDGASADKLAKVAELASLPVVTDNLRVCWEGDLMDRNCGRCFKCMSTQASLWVNGVAHPGAFVPACAPDDLRTLRTDQSYRRHIAQRLRDAAASAGRTDLLAPLDAALAAPGASR